MKRFFFRIAVAETSAFEACLETWRQVAPDKAGRAQLEARPFGLLLRLPATDVEPFLANATTPLSSFTRSRFLATARSFCAASTGGGVVRRSARGLRPGDSE